MIVAAALALGAGHAASAGAYVGAPPAGSPTGRVLVSLERTESASAARAFLRRSGARATGPVVPAIGLVTVDALPGRSAAATARALAALRGVRAAQPERRMAPRLVPNDPALSVPERSPGTPAGTPVQWTLAREGLPLAWDHARGDGALVAVIDTGVDAGHPEMVGKVRDAVDLDGDPANGPAGVDENGHGTAVAAQACAATGNATGLAGAGFGCRLIVEKHDFAEASVAAAIVDATQRGAHAINMSFGYEDRSAPPARALVDAVDLAYSRDVVLVAAAANEDTEEQGAPANLLQPTGTGPDPAQGKGLSVTAADFYDRRATFGRDVGGDPVRAGRGTQISLAAYGTFDADRGPGGLFTAFPGNTTDLERGTLVPPQPPCGCRASFAGDPRYAYLQGTSFAAPQVAAVGALLRDLNPPVPVARVLRIIKETARRPASTGWSPELGWGIVDAGAAVEAIRVIDLDPPTSRVTRSRRVRGRAVTLRWSGSDAARPGVVPAGIRSYRVYARRGSGPARRVAMTARRSARLRGRPGARYSVWTRALDRAGNLEPAPSRPDAAVRFLRRR